MGFRTTIDGALDLTEVTMSGAPTSAEIASAIEDFYARDTTRLTLWNLLDADLSGITAGGVRALADLSVRHGSKRPGGKTALVASQALAVGLMRMYETLTEIRGERSPGGLVVQYQIFDNVEAARRWLLE